MAESNPKSKIQNPKSRQSGVVVAHQPKFIQKLGSWVVFLALRALALTIRFNWDGCAEILARTPEGPMVFCTWHNRLGLCLEAYGKFKKVKPRLGVAAMVSASKDGGFLAAILERFRVIPVRGSSSRRGSQALLELTTLAGRGIDLAITPDGPRGPRYQVQDGVLALAQLTGLPIVPFSFRAVWKIEVKSWDRFQIPLPFTRCEMNAGRPVYVPRDISDADRERLRAQLEQTLRELSRE